jgi:hypothetical protein
MPETMPSGRLAVPAGNVPALHCDRALS